MNTSELNAQQRKSLQDFISKNEGRTGELQIQADQEHVALRSSPVLGELFPQYRFVEVPWIYHADRSSKKAFSFPGSGAVFDILALNEKGTEPFVFPSSGNREAYADFLRALSIQATDESVTRIWKAYLDLYQSGAGSPPQRHGPSIWRMDYRETPFRAISSTEEIREAYYYQLRVDSNGFITGGQLIVETVERRKIKA